MSKNYKITLNCILISLIVISCVVIGSALLKGYTTATIEDPREAILLHNEPASPIDPSIEPANNTQVPIEPQLPVEPQIPLEPIKEGKIEQRVPFTSQAPSAQWEIQTFQDGCEEASIIMGMLWVHDDKRISKKEAEAEILALAKKADDMFGASLDLSATDSTKLIQEYYGHTNVKLYTDISADDIIQALYRNSTVIIPVNGKKLFNPYFVEGGPENHMLIITGYDPKKEMFITNDPGTRRGEDFKYSKNTIENALRDYPTGFHEPNPVVQKSMIELWK